MAGPSGSAAPLSWLHRMENSGTLRSILGWLLMVIAVAPVAMREQTIVTDNTRAAMVLAGISLTFLFLLRPRLGSFYDWRGVMSGLVVFATSTVGFSFILANKGELTVERLYRSAQSSLIDLLSPAFSEPIAAFVVHPLYIIVAMILLISFAFKSYNGFLFVMALILVYGLFPFRPPLFVGYLLWFAGLWLVIDDALYLPRAVEERIAFSKGMRDLLVEVRKGPVSLNHALLLLTGQPLHGQHQLSPIHRHEMEQLAATNLIEFDGATQRFLATPTLSNSHTPPGVYALVEVSSMIASGLVLLGGGLYLLWPLDLLPEALLGPVGYIDDLIIASMSTLPAARWFLTKAPAMLPARTGRNGDGAAP